MIAMKTESGQRVLKDRSVPLSPRQRSAFILVDGKRTVEQILGATTIMGSTREDMNHLFVLGLITDAAPAVTAALARAQSAADAAAQQHKERTPQERYAEAYPIATRLTAELGLKGFRLNLAIESATNYESLLMVAPKIREAVGPGKYVALENALNDR